MGRCYECGKEVPKACLHQFGCRYDHNVILVCLYCLKKAAHIVAGTMKEATSASTASGDTNA